MHRLLSTLATWLVVSFALCNPVQASYTAHFIFGDSLSDTGNFNLLTGGALPPPYVNGRFSNGPVYSEIVSSALGLASIPSFAGGTNYAVGGARTDGHFIPALAPVASLQAQIGMYFGSYGSADSHALYTVYMGSNDLFDAVSAAAIDINLAISITQNAANIVLQSLQALISAGAQTIIVPTVTDLGLTPAVPNQAKSVASALAISFNGIIDAGIHNWVIGNSSLHIVRPDVFTLLDDAAANPQKYGLSNVTDPCFDGFVATPGTSVCSNPEQYLFWDIMHPTAAGHQFIANSVLAALPEPQSIALVMLALAALWAGRRRRSGV